MIQTHKTKSLLWAANCDSQGFLTGLISVVASHVFSQAVLKQIHNICKSAKKYKIWTLGASSYCPALFQGIQWLTSYPMTKIPYKQYWQVMYETLKAANKRSGGWNPLLVCTMIGKMDCVCPDGRLERGLFGGSLSRSKASKLCKQKGPGARS